MTDEGPGIAAEHLPHVFDRFYKAEASRAIRKGPGQSGGSGLGLSIVKAIIERHGGRISVSSEPGRTVFNVQLTAALLQIDADDLQGDVDDQDDRVAS